MRPDIVPGAVLPDYELSDHRGKHRTLSELQGSDPLVLVLSRGGFCPKDRRQHEIGRADVSDALYAWNRLAVTFRAAVGTYKPAAGTSAASA